MAVGSSLLVTLALAVATVGAEHWAVIVAGSRGYDNYRHQADACHAYHVVRNHGIPEENVVLMMYDDVATAKENPFPGKLFNKQANTSAEDVYAGCNVDYKGEDVTPENFLAVLRGDAKTTNGKKVLASGPDDRVFINFVDHGARGFVVFPHGQMLTSSQLTGTLESMYKQRRYKELVFYVEACHSGSMFWSWSMSHINAYVTTAANGWESSWGTYCPPMDYVDGVAMDTCLGDLYSVNWMEDSDLTDLSRETLSQQFNLVKKKTRKSHVQQYGSSRVRREIVGDYLSNYDVEAGVIPSNDENPSVGTQSGGEVDAHDIPLVLAFYRYLRTPAGSRRSALAERLMQEIKLRKRADRLFARIRESYRGKYDGGSISMKAGASSETSKCKARVLELFSTLVVQDGEFTQPTDMPPGFSSYSLKYAGVLDDLCGQLKSVDAAEAILMSAFQEGAYDTSDQGTPTLQ